MTLTLFEHPFSSYCQKALIAIYENEVPLVRRRLDDPATYAAFSELWPIKRFPLLLDGDRMVVEASIIIEHLQVHHPGPVTLIPRDPAAALEVRMLDRFFDLYISTPQQKIVFDALRPEDEHDRYGVAEARAMLDNAYGWLDAFMVARPWAAGDAFTLADCAAAPALFYADWTHRIGTEFPHVRAYRRRLLARPSFARLVDEAREFRPNFPLGAPDRD